MDRIEKREQGSKSIAELKIPDIRIYEEPVGGGPGDAGTLGWGLYRYDHFSCKFIIATKGNGTFILALGERFCDYGDPKERGEGLLNRASLELYGERWESSNGKFEAREAWGSLEAGVSAIAGEVSVDIGTGEVSLDPHDDFQLDIDSYTLDNGETLRNACSLALESVCFGGFDRLTYASNFSIRSAPQELWVNVPTVRKNDAYTTGWIEILCAPAKVYTPECQRYIERNEEKLIKESTEFLRTDFMRTYLWLKYQFRIAADRYIGDEDKDTKQIKQLFVSTFDGTWEKFLRGEPNTFSDEDVFSRFCVHHIRHATGGITSAERNGSLERLKDPGFILFCIMEGNLNVLDDNGKTEESVPKYRHPAMRKLIEEISFDWRDFAMECGINICSE